MKLMLKEALNCIFLLKGKAANFVVLCDKNHNLLRFQTVGFMRAVVINFYFDLKETYGR